MKFKLNLLKIHYKIGNVSASHRFFDVLKIDLCKLRHEYPDYAGGSQVRK